MKVFRCGMILLTILLLSGCAAPEEEPCRRELLAMDTVMTLTVYGENGEQAARLGEARIRELEALLSVTGEDSELYRANHSGGAPTHLSADTSALLTQALALCEDTSGALDVTIYPVVRAWGFTTGSYRIPSEEEIRGLLEQVDYTRVALTDGSLTLPEGMELDLGAVAKGYTGDQLMSLFVREGVTSAIVELGGNVQALGAKPDGSPWQVALQAPEGGYAGVLRVINKAVVTSGGYQRYFEENGETYWHIMDPSTGRPARSGLLSVTIVADRGVVGDALSTALFVMGKEDAAAYWRARQDFDFVLLDEAGGVTITQGLEDSFSLYGDWADHPLEVLRP